MTEVKKKYSIIDKMIDLAKEYNLDACIDYIKEFSVGKQRNEDTNAVIKSFLGTFPGLSECFLSQIGIASNFYLWSILITDKILDEKTDKLNKEVLLFSYVLREESLKIMYDLFPSGNKFWQYFEKYYKEYTHAVISEINCHFNKFCSYTTDELEMIYGGNSSFAKAIPTAFAIKSNKIEIIAPIEDSIKYFYIALNIFDDVNDWKKDYANGQYSYLLSRTVLDNNLEEQLSNMNIADIGKHVFFSGTASKTLELSIEYFQKSLETVKNLNCPLWRDIIESKLNSCIVFKKDIDMLVQKQLTIAGIIKNVEIEKKIPQFNMVLPEPKNEWGQILNHTLDYVYKQWKLDFLEATNYKYFPEEYSPVGMNTERYLISNIFERAVITEILLDVDKNLNIILQPMIEHEVKYLIGSRVSDSEGWNFYHNCPYLVSDADTTSQVIEVLIKAGKKNLVDKYGKIPIDTLLKHQSHADGSVGTWILTTDEICDEKEKLKRQFYDKVILEVSDVITNDEVVANLLYALYLYDKDNYKDAIDKGIKYLEQSQYEKGYWKSTWYLGPYYGTYVSLRIFCDIKPDSPAILKANNYIISTQNDDGGWGYKPKISDPLNTAFSLICLSYLKDIGISDYSSIIEKALHYLLSNILEDHYWPAVNFIDYGVAKTPFKSKTITNVYILKAASLWN
jgi:squalene-hopene/tetraprenyl-beta-curcumene cyclase